MGGAADNGLLLGLESASRGRRSRPTTSGTFKSFRAFTDMNDIMLNWKKLSRTMLLGKRSGDDRPNIIEELREVISDKDYRIGVIVTVMASSGM